MTQPNLGIGGKGVVELADIPAFFTAFQQRGHKILGPTIRDGAIVYDELTSVADLPIGWTDEQEGGTYRLKRRDDDALFGYAVGPHSWKQFLHPSYQVLWRAKRDGDGLHYEPQEEPPKVAFIGARSCDLHAIAIQDKIMTGGPHVDPYYLARRERAFIVAVNCFQAGGTCFCVSQKTGPKATMGYDLALTEVLDGAQHYFLVEVGSEQGAEFMRDIPYRNAETGEINKADEKVEECAAHMGRTMDNTNIKELLYGNLEHPRWDNVADRCLACGNCTMVCPTCFCFNVEDVTSPSGTFIERIRRLDVCYTNQFTYTAGRPLRESHKARYRQWLTHKVGSWIDQFGTSGCVGCGRCITWCPVAIDITEEVAAIRATPGVKGRAA